MEYNGRKSAKFVKSVDYLKSIEDYYDSKQSASEI